jgi:hypothetical protein
MLKMKYFVLKPNGDDQYAEASRRAMRAYADMLDHLAVDRDDAVFANQLREWADDEGAKAAPQPLIDEPSR